MNNDKTSEIQLENISKSFYGVEVLKDINLIFKTGEVHILCGENGAGKSTLIKIIAGLYKPSKGVMRIAGQIVNFSAPIESENVGIAIVYQELSLCPTISISENIFLNREYGRVFVNKRQMRENAKNLMEEVGLKINPNILVKDLSIAEMQQVQIAKALSQNAKFVILDEPCSSLTEDESDKLFLLLKKLKSNGVGIIYIDHRLENFNKIGDKVTVLRDGMMVGTMNIADITRDSIVHMMVGREISSLFNKSNNQTDHVVLQVENMTNDKIHDISFSVHEGEVFGLGGMVGAGRSEIVRAIFGADKINPKGIININGVRLRRNTPIKSIRQGIGYVPEDRKLQSLILRKNVVFNISLVFMDLINKGLFVNSLKQDKSAQKQINQMNIKIIKKGAEISELSGGNQQKVVIGKWLLNDNLKVLLLDEPTRGVDVGVKAEIYKLIDDLAGSGVAIILITSELPELLGLSDRIAVINDGKIAGILMKSEFSQEAIVHLCV